jgi:plasmid stabilization system protein ParE
MQPCTYCGVPTPLFISDRPVCAHCSDFPDAGKTPPKKPVSPERGSTGPDERSRIVTILYNEVMRAQQAVQETKHEGAESRRSAQAALERAVRRYTDFTLDGRVPEDIHTGARPAGSGENVA